MLMCHLTVADTGFPFKGAPTSRWGGGGTIIWPNPPEKMHEIEENWAGMSV